MKDINTIQDYGTKKYRGSGLENNQLATREIVYPHITDFDQNTNMTKAERNIHIKIIMTYEFVKRSLVCFGNNTVKIYFMISRSIHDVLNDSHSPLM